MRFSLKAPSLLKWKNVTGLRCRLDFLGHSDGSPQQWFSNYTVCRHHLGKTEMRVEGPARQAFRLLWWLSGKESASNAGDSGFSPWVGRIPWRRERQPPPAFLPGESHGRGAWGRGGWWCSPWDCKRIRQDLATKQQQQGKDSDLAGGGRAQESVVFSKQCRWLWCKYSEAPSSLRSHLLSTGLSPKH